MRIELCKVVDVTVNSYFTKITRVGTNTSLFHFLETSSVSETEFMCRLTHWN